MLTLWAGDAEDDARTFSEVQEIFNSRTGGRLSPTFDNIGRVIGIRGSNAKGEERHLSVWVLESTRNDRHAQESTAALTRTVRIHGVLRSLDREAWA